MIWIKIMGQILVVAAAAYVGASASERLKRRTLLLEKCQSFLTFTATMIRYSHATVGEIMESASRQEEFKELGFPAGCHALLEEGFPFPEAWQHSLDCCKGLCLDSGDRSLLAELGGSLGTSDVEGQLETIRLFETRLSLRLDGARELQKTKGKLYRSLGVLSGLGLVVLLI